MKDSLKYYTMAQARDDESDDGHSSDGDDDSDTESVDSGSSGEAMAQVESDLDSVSSHSLGSNSEELA